MSSVEPTKEVEYPPLWHLLVKEPTGGWRAELLRPSVIIGRAHDCDIRIVDEHADDRHARIRRRADGLFEIEDLNGGGDLLIETGRAIRPGERVILERGLRFKLGRTIIAADYVGRVPESAYYNLPLSVPPEMLAPWMGRNGADADPSNEQTMSRPLVAELARPTTPSPMLRPPVAAGPAMHGSEDATGAMPFLGGERDTSVRSVVESVPDGLRTRQEKLRRPRITIEAPNLRRIVRIEAAEMIIGRVTESKSPHPNADLVIPVPALSAPQCSIFERADRFFIRDLDSKNGTFVNGKRLGPGEDFELFTGTFIRLGPVFLHYHDGNVDRPVPYVVSEQTAIDRLVASSRLTRENVDKCLADWQHAVRHQSLGFADEGPKPLDTMRDADLDELTLGEMLVVRGYIGLREWVEARRHNSRLANPPPAKSSGAEALPPTVRAPAAPRPAAPAYPPTMAVPPIETAPPTVRAPSVLAGPAPSRRGLWIVVLAMLAVFAMAGAAIVVFRYLQHS